MPRSCGPSSVPSTPGGSTLSISIGGGSSSSRRPLPQSARGQRPSEPPPKCLSIGGRVGPGHRINGTYEILEGQAINGRPCWLRRNRLNLDYRGEGRDLEVLEGAELFSDADERPLYCFLSEMGYWTVAPSLHATGVHVYARNGPDFGVPSPDVATRTWIVFANGKALPDPQMVCFKHDLAFQPPEILQLSGCTGQHGQLNGLYHHARGVVGSRPVFIKDGLRGVTKEEKKLVHFSQRTGTWLVSSAVAIPKNPPVDPHATEAVAMVDGADAAAGSGQDSAIEWSDLVILAKSPVAWGSMSPVHMIPKEAWLTRGEMPPRRHHRRAAYISRGNDAIEEVYSFQPSDDLRIAIWAHGFSDKILSRFEQADSASTEPLSSETPSGLPAPVSNCQRLVRTRSGHLLAPPMSRICFNLRSPQGISDPYHINGDYTQQDQCYNDRPVYIKWAPGAQPLREEGEDTSSGPTWWHGRQGSLPKSANYDGRMCLFFDDMSGRWHLAILVGDTAGSFARSPPDWTMVTPPLGVLWQLRVPNAVELLGCEMGLRRQQSATPLFHDWDDLSVAAIKHKALPRTVIFGGKSIAEALPQHTLSGDFRLMQDCYGCRPVYRRGARTDNPALFLFFETRSGYWLVSSGSPFSANHSMPVGTAGLFGEIFARAGPAWAPFTPDDAESWEIFDMQALRPEDLLEYHGRAPNCLLSPLFSPAPRLQLHALSSEAPKLLTVGGFGSRTSTLNGIYELLEEVRWNSRPAWQRIKQHWEVSEYSKFIFWWPETGHWLFGSELHEPVSTLARNGPGRWGAEFPDLCSGRWDALNGKVYEEDHRIYVRRQRTAAGGGEAPVVALPCGSPRPHLSSRHTASSARGLRAEDMGIVAGALPASSPRGMRQTMPFGVHGAQEPARHPRSPRANGREARSNSRGRMKQTEAVKRLPSPRQSCDQVQSGSQGARPLAASVSAIPSAPPSDQEDAEAMPFMAFPDAPEAAPIDEAVEPPPVVSATPVPAAPPPRVGSPGRMRREQGSVCISFHGGTGSVRREDPVAPPAAPKRRALSPVRGGPMPAASASRSPSPAGGRQRYTSPFRWKM